MMIMEGSKKYELKAIMYSAYDTPHKLWKLDYLATQITTQ